jgi:hypothetical protein
MSVDPTDWHGETIMTRPGYQAEIPDDPAEPFRGEPECTPLDLSG